jgi:hypothetical protein
MDEFGNRGRFIICNTSSGRRLIRLPWSIVRGTGMLGSPELRSSLGPAYSRKVLNRDSACDKAAKLS